MKIRSIFLILLLSATVLSSTQAQIPAAEDSAPSVSDPISVQQNGYVRPDAKTRRSRWVKDMIAPGALAKAVAGAGISTARNTPREWGPHWDGFGKRVASNVGRNVIGRSIQFGMDEALTLDSHFYRSEDRGFKAKFVNAVISPVTARKANGKRTIGVPRLAGVYGSHIIAAETWMPERYTVKDGIRSGTISLGISAAYNLFREFVWKR